MKNTPIRTFNSLAKVGETPPRQAFLYQQDNGCIHIERMENGLRCMPTYNIGMDEAEELAHDFVNYY